MSVKIVKVRFNSAIKSTPKAKVAEPSHVNLLKVKNYRKRLREQDKSRREIEAMIAENRVSVDGKMATSGDRIDGVIPV